MSFERIAEEKIREAIEQGVFENVAGMGKPLAPLDDEKPSVRAAMVEWERAIELTGSAMHPLATRAGQNYRKAAAAVNTKIDLHNIHCPLFQLELVRFREDARPNVTA